MNREKEIEEMMKAICQAVHFRGKGLIDLEETATALVESGYGDVKQAVKEFAEKALHLIHTYLDTETDYTPSMTCKDIFDNLFKEMYGND